jgi:hypothetical protein
MPHASTSLFKGRTDVERIMTAVMGGLLVSDTFNPQKVNDTVVGAPVDPITGEATGAGAGSTGGQSGSAGGAVGDGAGGVTSSSVTLPIGATPLPTTGGDGGKFMVKLTAIMPLFKETPQASFKHGTLIF